MGGGGLLGTIRALGEVGVWLRDDDRGWCFWLGAGGGVEVEGVWMEAPDTTFRVYHPPSSTVDPFVGFFK